MRLELIAHKNPKSPNSEIFRTLRTNIQFMNTKKKMKTLLITSSIPAEGKSWVASNLAVTFAQAGKKVCIIDADMRKGRQYRIFEVSPSPGLSNYLSDAEVDEEGNSSAKVTDYIQETEVPNLYLISAGNVPPNPSELLVSGQMVKFLDDLKEIFDLVIIDGTPCELVTDSIILSRIVDCTVLVAAYKLTKRDILDRVIKNIQNVGGNLAGVVFNKIVTNKKYDQQYYYYGSSKSKKTGEKAKTFVFGDIAKKLKSEEKTESTDTAETNPDNDELEKNIKELYRKMNEHQEAINNYEPDEEFKEEVLEDNNLENENNSNSSEEIIDNNDNNNENNDSNNDNSNDDNNENYENNENNENVENNESNEEIIENEYSENNIEEPKEEYIEENTSNENSYENDYKEPEIENIANNYEENYENKEESYENNYDNNYDNNYSYDYNNNYENSFNNENNTENNYQKNIDNSNDYLIKENTGWQEEQNATNWQENYNQETYNYGDQNKENYFEEKIETEKEENNSKSTLEQFYYQENSYNNNDNYNNYNNYNNNNDSYNYNNSYEKKEMTFEEKSEDIMRQINDYLDQENQ